MSPAKLRTVVVLPAPFRPRRTAVSPSSIENEIPWRTWSDPYPTRRSSTSSRDIGGLLFGFAAEVSGHDLGVVLYLLGDALGQDLAEVQHVYVIADTHDQRHVVLDHQHGEVEGLAQLEESLTEIVRFLGSHARRR